VRKITGLLIFAILTGDFLMADYTAEKYISDVKAGRVITC
jgi:hypothetical protein